MTGFYSERDLDRITTLSRATRWRHRQDGSFPTPIRISSGRVAYPVEVIHDWVEAQKSGAGIAA